MTLLYKLWTQHYHYTTTFKNNVKLDHNFFQTSTTKTNLHVWHYTLCYMSLQKSSSALHQKLAKEPPFGTTELLPFCECMSYTSLPFFLHTSVTHHFSLIQPKAVHIQSCTPPLGHKHRWSSPGELGRRTQTAVCRTQMGSEALSWHPTSHRKTM